MHYAKCVYKKKLTCLLFRDGVQNPGTAALFDMTWLGRLHCMTRNPVSIYPCVLCDHSGREFRGIRQLLLLIYMATAGGFPGIPVRNGRKERGVMGMSRFFVQWGQTRANAALATNCRLFAGQRERELHFIAGCTHL